MSHHLIRRIMTLALMLSASLTACAQYKVTHLGKPYNTAGSETGALRVGDTVLVYASLPPAAGKGNAFGFNNAVTQLYQARISRDGKVARPKPNRWGINSQKDHTGNLCIDPWSRDLYFTRGDIETLHCEIWTAHRQKRYWGKPHRLRGALNHKQYTATHPTVGRQQDSTLLLYFVSDRPGGMGGMDIWYSIIKDGVAGEPVNLGPQVNSSADEYTPFYDQQNGILYFSSDRDGGMGGFDIYCAVGERNTWQKAEPACSCLNSEQNDLYFTVTDHDPATGFPIGGYLSSNRKDSYFLNDSMCCNDIYRWELDSSEFRIRSSELIEANDTIIPNSELQTPNFFPLALYFHNDDPDPGSRNSVTTADYADCQLRYALMRHEYLAHQHTLTDSTAMQQFFDSCVVGNFDKVENMLNYAAQALAGGKQVRITVAGYASPVHTNDYNHLLSQRRIASFINMLRAWHHGALADALADGRLQVQQQPMGIDELSPFNPRSANAIYSLPAALSRRIEVRSCEIF